MCEKNKNLETLIPIYAEHKEQFDSLKKVCDEENKNIKKEMRGLKNSEYFVGKYVAKYIVQTRESLNEDMLIKIAHLYGIPEIIKTKEYIDFDVLEDAIYNHRIPTDVLVEMDKAKEVKEVETLRISKVKEKKDE